MYANIRKFLTYILTSNVPELVPYLAFVLFRVPLGLTIVQILAVDLGTDVLPALGLGAEKPEADTMSQPPRSRDERLLSSAVLVRAYLFLGVLESLGAMVVFFLVLWLGGWRFGQVLEDRDPLYLRGTTACLATIIVMQIVNVFLCRSDRQSALRAFWDNRLILWGIVVEVVLILLISYSFLGNVLLGTAPLPALFWLFPLPFALLMLVLEEGRKAWQRYRSVLGTHKLTVRNCHTKPGNDPE